MTTDARLSAAPGANDRTPLWKQALRRTYLLVMLVGFNAAGVWLVQGGYPRWSVALIALLAVATSFVVERLIPYHSEWNVAHGDVGRDWLHFIVNEASNFATVAVLPLVAGLGVSVGGWPHQWPLAGQLAVAIVIFDFGVTLTHRASHKSSTLWRFHAVHHAVKRHYGFNGLMKHPLHQSVEMVAGAAPLFLLGMPQDVAALLAMATVVQLLLQHSNADYATGPLGSLLALNKGHRFHHLRAPGMGDVNFGLFTNVWDKLLGTWSYDAQRRFTSEDFGVEGEPDYPTGYVAQLTRPFRSS